MKITLSLIVLQINVLFFEKVSTKCQCLSFTEYKASLTKVSSMKKGIIICFCIDLWYDDINELKFFD